MDVDSHRAFRHGDLANISGTCLTLGGSRSRPWLSFVHDICYIVANLVPTHLRRLSWLPESQDLPTDGRPRAHHRSATSLNTCRAALVVHDSAALCQFAASESRHGASGIEVARGRLRSPVPRSSGEDVADFVIPDRLYTSADPACPSRSPTVQEAMGT
nr:hypothetical protein CFP56_28502 [Quercus suber]